MARRNSEQPHKDKVKREPWTPWGKWAKRRRERKEQKRLAKIKRKEEHIRRRRLARLRRRMLMARGSVFVLLFGLGVVVVFIVLTLLGRPYPWESVRDLSRLQDIQLELPEQQSRWQSLAVNHYRIEVTYNRNDDIACGPAILEVRDSEIIDMPDNDDEAWSQACSRLVANLTIESAFGLLNEEVNIFEASSTILQASFDQDFGYLTLISVDRYDERSSGCCWQATWNELQPQ